MIGPLPPWMLFLVTFSFGRYLWKTRRKSSKTNPRKTIPHPPMQTDPSVLEQLDKAHAGWTKKVIKSCVYLDDMINVIDKSKIGTEIHVELIADTYLNISIGNVQLDPCFAERCSFDIVSIVRKYPFRLYLTGKTPPCPGGLTKRELDYEVTLFIKKTKYTCENKEN